MKIIKLLKLLMLYIGCKEVGKVIETLIYIAAMMGIMIFVCVLCGVMELVS